MPLKLIVESDFWDYDIINEQVQGKPRQIKLRGPYMVAERKNLNKRSYPYEDLLKESERFNKDWIKTGRAFGELEHPNYSHINPERACHRIISLEESDNKVFIGTSVIMATDQEHAIQGTPLGDIAASIIQYGGKLGMSTRGVGRLEESIVHEYKLSTVDVVSDPSIGDFVDGILESKNYMIDCHGGICEMGYEGLTEDLATLPNKDKADYIGEAMTKFLTIITGKCQ